MKGAGRKKFNVRAYVSSEEEAFYGGKLEETTVFLRVAKYLGHSILAAE